jgi:hypothetical protein
MKTTVKNVIIYRIDPTQVNTSYCFSNSSQNVTVKPKNETINLLYFTIKNYKLFIKIFSPFNDSSQKILVRISFSRGFEHFPINTPRFFSFYIKCLV